MCLCKMCTPMAHTRICFYGSVEYEYIPVPLPGSTRTRYAATVEADSCWRALARVRAASAASHIELRNLFAFWQGTTSCFQTTFNLKR